MAATTDTLLQDALELTDAERAELAALLLDSLEAEEESGVEAAWRSEIERRIRDLDSGVVEAVPWQEARRRLRSGLDE